MRRRRRRPLASSTAPRTGRITTANGKPLVAVDLLAAPHTGTERFVSALSAHRPASIATVATAITVAVIM